MHQGMMEPLAIPASKLLAMAATAIGLSSLAGHLDSPRTTHSTFSNSVYAFAAKFVAARKFRREPGSHDPQRRRARYPSISYLGRATP